jgi:hypothetical protein
LVLDNVTPLALPFGKYSAFRGLSMSKSDKRPYKKPKITKVKLEDKRVVAMAVCKDSLDNNACAQDGVTPLFQINPS